MPVPPVKPNPLTAGLKNFALLAGAVLFAFLLAEMIFRFIYREPAAPAPQKVIVHEASDNLKLLYKPSPNMQNEAYGVLNKINSAGFRDREYPREKPAGVKRIVLLGDSVVYGYGLTLEQTLAKKLEALFVKAGQAVEVLNFGVSGYDSQQAVEFFKTLALDFSPDLVIAGYTLNDSIYSSMELDFFHDHEDRFVRLDRPELRKRFWGFLFTHSKILKYLDQRLGLQKKFKAVRSYREQGIWHYLQDRNTRIKDPLDSPYQQLKEKIIAEARQADTPQENLKKMLGFAGIENEDFYSSHWNVSKKAFEELSGLSRERGFKVTAVIFPYGADLEHYALTPLHTFLGEEFRGLGFGVIDLLPLAVNRGASQPKLFFDLIHFTPEGIDEAAQAIYDGLAGTL